MSLAKRMFCLHFPLTAYYCHVFFSLFVLFIFLFLLLSFSLCSFFFFPHYFLELQVFSRIRVEYLADRYYFDGFSFWLRIFPTLQPPVSFLYCFFSLFILWLCELPLWNHYFHIFLLLKFMIVCVILATSFIDTFFDLQDLFFFSYVLLLLCLFWLRRVFF